ncbi:hypothetical protein GCM10009715_03280 [Paeniglutamicibacter psychrophenolicus]|uniref:Uncharacterized protein n=1 Tax=Paeniglutamicibacter psychrophenolicus TaxID=257454 RepID=A0ABS4WAV9_9MICC|nr:hypothetical protein [Paeniglutamicibacter psychrophenolicus]MBP2373347.1 hypothetical protein [Paeniglutamicibacter psychrophenolicus]
MATKKTIALGTSAAALALVTGLGLASVASAADTTGTVSDTTSGITQSLPSERGGHGGHRGGGPEMASGLAEKLGVEESKLSDALDTFREANKPAERIKDAARPDREERDAALAKSLAQTLGIEESEVTAALEELRTESNAERAAALTSKLDAAVKDGTPTQGEADAVTKATEKGVIGGR